uniref:uncharacterized protein LOC120336009 n=1 Tax=Styela clava TaxID=7725 RepID=UPI0019397682|nr:uncharacterized protein LOC120336009 [Styela clava]
MNIIFFTFILIFLTLSTEVKADKGNMVPNGTCKYHVSYNNAITFSKANATCKSMGGSLAMMKTTAIQDFVESQIIYRYRNWGGTVDFWIGAYKENKKWIWMDGSSISDMDMRFAWSAVKTSSGYLFMSSYETTRNNMRWINNGGTKLRDYICEISVFDRCSTNVCDNGGTCNQIGCQSNCMCTPGYFGEFCTSESISILPTETNYTIFVGQSVSVDLTILSYDGPVKIKVFKNDDFATSVATKSNVTGTVSFTFGPFGPGREKLTYNFRAKSESSSHAYYKTTSVTILLKGKLQLINWNVSNNEDLLSCTFEGYPAPKTTGILRISLVKFLETTEVHCFAQNDYETSAVHKFLINNDVIFENNIIYRIFWKQKDRRSYYKAKELCHSSGGNLVTISNDLTQNAISKKLQNIGVDVDVYIGATRKIQERKIEWKWQNGFAFYDETKNGKWNERNNRSSNGQYIGWKDGEPNNIMFDCASMSYWGLWYWNVVQCNRTIGFICENLASSTLPSLKIEECGTAIKITFYASLEALNITHRIEVSEKNSSQSLASHETVAVRRMNSIFFNNLQYSTMYMIKLILCPAECVHPPTTHKYVITSSAESPKHCDVVLMDESNTESKVNLSLILPSSILGTTVVLLFLASFILCIKLRSRVDTRDSIRHDASTDEVTVPYQTTYMKHKSQKDVNGYENTNLTPNTTERLKASENVIDTANAPNKCNNFIIKAEYVRQVESYETPMQLNKIQNNSVYEDIQNTSGVKMNTNTMIYI